MEMRDDRVKIHAFRSVFADARTRVRRAFFNASLFDFGSLSVFSRGCGYKLIFRTGAFPRTLLLKAELTESMGSALKSARVDRTRVQPV